MFSLCAKLREYPPFDIFQNRSATFFVAEARQLEAELSSG